MKAKTFLLLMIAGLTSSCKTNQPVAQAPPEAALPGLSVTLWSNRTELFMEYPTLVRGQNAAFSVHLTDLDSYRPLAEARATLEMEKDGKVLQFASRTSPRPGIFRVDVTPAEAGRYRSVLKVEASKFADQHQLGELVVYEDAAAALRNSGVPPSPGEVIRFLKEQQWSTEFATEVAVARKIQESLQVPAIVQPRGGAEGSAVSPVQGYLQSGSQLPVPGQMVDKGQLIAIVLAFTSTPQDPAGLQLELSQAETDLAQANRVRKRLEDLLAERAIPARKVEEAKADEDRARARVDAARARIAQYERSRSGFSASDGPPINAFQVKAPLRGMVTSLSAAAGGVVEAGQEILHIMAIDRVWVAAEVPEGDAGVLRGLRSAEIDVPGLDRPIKVPGDRGRIQRIGSIVNPDTRRIPVIFEMENQDGLFRIGQALVARLGRGEAREQVSLSVSSIVDDGGRPVVFVQVDGESFQRRAVRTGAVGGGYVQITEGITAGERIVSKGAYLIRLAALSTQIPAHGHVH